MADDGELWLYMPAMPDRSLLTGLVLYEGTLVRLQPAQVTGFTLQDTRVFVVANEPVADRWTMDLRNILRQSLDGTVIPYGRVWTGEGTPQGFMKLLAPIVSFQAGGRTLRVVPVDAKQLSELGPQ